MKTKNHMTSFQELVDFIEIEANRKVEEIKKQKNGSNEEINPQNI